ncbi:MAG: hypothetical protein JHC31_05265 [Sulfurihydrogenibium sp.]|nr:hypothetical protein [Sulfurihydrogenibium sp.]
MKYKIEAVKVSDKEAIRIKKDNKEFIYQSKEPLILIDNDVAVKIYPLYSKLYEPKAEIEIKENKRSGCKYIILNKNRKRKPISIGEKININGKKYKLIRLK